RPGSREQCDQTQSMRQDLDPDHRWKRRNSTHRQRRRQRHGPERRECRKSGARFRHGNVHHGIPRAFPRRQPARFARWRRRDHCSLSRAPRKLIAIMANTPDRTKNSPATVRILLVDDHPMVRERLAEVITRESDLKVCAEAEDRATALKAIQETSPDLAIVDLALKSSSGLELIKDVHTRWPQLKVLVVSMHDESL